MNKSVEESESVEAKLAKANLERKRMKAMLKILHNIGLVMMIIVIAGNHSSSSAEAIDTFHRSFLVVTLIIIQTLHELKQEKI